jgi:hypothetical protein
MLPNNPVRTWFLAIAVKIRHLMSPKSEHARLALLEL